MILQDTTFGLLEVANPYLEEYIGNKIKKKHLKFFKEYQNYFDLENQLQNQLEFLETELLDYYKFINKALKNKHIEEHQFHHAVDTFRSYLIITRQNGQVLGSLISEELQKEIGFTTIYPKIKLESDN